MLNYIPDGYTQRGYIEASAGLHYALAFAFRPMLPEERDAVEEVLALRPAREGSQVTAAAVAHALLEWDLCDANGCPVPVGIEYVRRLRPALLDKLYSVVSGREAGDPPPMKTEAEEQDFVARLLEAAGTGCTPWEATLEADRKN
jgi:hypothetical protein